MLPKQHSYVVA